MAPKSPQVHGSALDHHHHLIAPAAMAARARDAAGQAVEAILVAAGQYSPDPNACERVLVLALKWQAGAVLADGWMAAGARDALCAHLADLAPRQGACDAMYATAWRCAWTTDGGGFEVWDEGGRLLWHDAHGVHLRDVTAPLDVCGVHGFVRNGWVKRGVALRLTKGGGLELMAVDEEAAVIDPTYDGLDLLTDASWVVALARAVADGLGVPVHLDAALR